MGLAGSWIATLTGSLAEGTVTDVDGAGRDEMTKHGKVAAVVLAAIAVQALIFAGAAAWVGSFRSVDVGAVAWSHRYYYEYATQAVSGRLPYRDFAFEYPPLSFPLFLIPRLVAADFESYQVAFVVEMFLFDAAAIILIARWVAVGGAATVARRLGWYTLASFLLAPLMIGRFEVPPMVVAFAAAGWWTSGRGTPGGVAAGLGALMKIFPGAAAAPALVREAATWRKEKPRGTVAFLATVGVGLAAWLSVAGGRMGESLGYHAGRGLEIESLFGGLVLLAGSLAGRAVPWVFDHNSYHLAPGWGSVLAPVAIPLQAVALALVVWRFRRTGLADEMRYAAAAVVAFIVAGKVLSPQYLIWSLPFLAVIGGPAGRLARPIYLLCCFTTALIYPGPGFAMILEHQVGAILLLNLRNALLLWLLGLLLFGPAGGDADVGPATMAPGVRSGASPESAGSGIRW